MNLDQLLLEEELINIEQNENENKTDINCVEIYPTPEDYTLSTMTAYCKLGIKINKENVAKYFKIEDDPTPLQKWKLFFYRLMKKINLSKKDKKGDIKNKYGKIYLGIKGCGMERGMVSKKVKIRKNNRKHGDFQNQVTIRISPYRNEQIICTKICCNGTLHMTGIKSMEHCKLAAYYIIKRLKNTVDSNNKPCIFENNDTKLSINNISTALINTNFNAYFPINLVVLNNILNEKNIFCSYENSKYPGINIKYNSSVSCNKTEHPMNSKGKFKCDCKTLTIVPFQSGNVIITAASNIKQIEDAYKFINNIFKENFNKIVLRGLNIKQLIENKNVIPCKILYNKYGKEVIVLNEDDFNKI